MNHSAFRVGHRCVNPLAKVSVSGRNRNLPYCDDTPSIAMNRTCKQRRFAVLLASR